MSLETSLGSACYVKAKAAKEKGEPYECECPAVDCTHHSGDYLDDDADWGAWRFSERHC